jgi:predicted small lipoprotein YifL
MLRHFRLFAALFTSCALASCGIKGPLVLPPAAAPAATPANPSAPAPAPADADATKRKP